MKKSLKDLLSSVIIALTTSFMFFIYEPIIMYSGNVNDFWFDLNLLLSSNIKFFLIAFVTILMILTIIYIIDILIWKKTKIYNYILIMGYILFLILYIHGNFFAGNLPPLDGSDINWANYIKFNIISIIICILIASSFIFASFKFKLNKIIKYSNYIICSIFLMLSISLLPTIIGNKDIYMDKISSISTYDNLQKYSDKKNFIIFLLDAVDSQTFKEEIKKNDDYKKMLADFTYYPDTLAAYPFTRDSIPFIFSGEWNENKTDFITYATNAYNNSKLLNLLENKKYELNYYDYEISWNDHKISKFKNYQLCNQKVNAIFMLKQEIKYDIYKYFPYFLKKYSKIETLNFDLAKIADVPKENFNWSDDYFINYIKDNDIEVTSENQFKFIHLEGAHTPFDLDKNLKKIEDGTYTQKVEASITVIKEYLKELKENNIYDNSIIIIMADHGFIWGNKIGRQNPIFLVKGNEDKHSFLESDLPISYEDLNIGYENLLNNKHGDEMFLGIDKTKNRRFLWYDYTKENHMVEFLQTGKAWEEDTFNPTGNEFNR